MTRYVAGFMFSEDRPRVLLIEKQRPAWQKGRLNGIGGHIEPGETPWEAQRREFLEEAVFGFDDWKSFAEVIAADQSWSVTFFRGFNDVALEYKLLLDAELHPVGLLFWDCRLDDDVARRLAERYLAAAHYVSLPVLSIEHGLYAEPHKPDNQPWRVEARPDGRAATYLRFE